MEYKDSLIPETIVDSLYRGEKAYLVRTAPNGEHWVMSEKEFQNWDGHIFFSQRFRLETGEELFLVDESTEELTGKPCRFPVVCRL